ncbi:M24 family metallopeptidase [Microbacterium sp. NPDC055683]
MSPHSAGVTLADRAVKTSRITGILERRGLDAVRLTSGEALSWLFDGARTSVPVGGAAVFSASVGRDGQVRVRALRNEAERLAAEELPGADIDVVDWFAPLDAIEPGEAAESAISAELRAARAALLPSEVQRFRALGADAAAALTEALSGAHPDETESALAGRLASAVYARGAEPVVVLVAGAARSGVQHPVPTAHPLGRRAMAVVTAKRHGLHASATRWVRFGGAEPEAAARIREVEAEAWAATRPGRTLADVLSDIAAAYLQHGFGPDAWLRHHQGGPTGYAGRDPKAAPTSRERVDVDQAFAWNPWAPGAKAEDTVLVGAAGIQALTIDPAWPTTAVRGMARPAELDLG